MLSKIRKITGIKFIFLVAFLTFILKIPGSIIGDTLVDLVGLGYPPFTSDEQIPEITVEDFIGAVLVAPPIETLFGQFLPIRIMGKFTKNNKIKIIISSIIFSLFHLPVLGFLLSAFIIGLIFSWSYIVKKEDKKRAFLIVTFIHLTHNFLAFSVSMILPTN